MWGFSFWGILFFIYKIIFKMNYLFIIYLSEFILLYVCIIKRFINFKKIIIYKFLF